MVAIIKSVNPKAKETPRRPIPTPGKPAANTALPQPPKTNQNVPMNSARFFSCYFFKVWNYILTERIFLEFLC